MGRYASLVFDRLAYDREGELRLPPNQIETLQQEWAAFAREGFAPEVFDELLQVVDYLSEAHTLAAAELFFALEWFLPILKQPSRERSSRRFLQARRNLAAHIEQRRPQGAQRLGTGVLPVRGNRHIIR